MKKALKIMTGIAVYCVTMSAFAIDQAAVEDNTPPSAEGPLTTDQIMPSLSPLPTTKAPPTTTTGAQPQTMLPLPQANSPNAPAPSPPQPTTSTSETPPS